MKGPRSSVLVLGSTHLSEMPESYQPSSLDNLLNRLAAFKPDIITIEAIPGEECYMASRQPDRFSARYCASTKEAEAATGLDIPAALIEMRTILKDWPSNPTADQRRHLASVFLAANDRASAYVQWLQLPATEQKIGDGLNEPLVKLLNEVAATNNENYQIGSKLAARLGHARVYAIDNRTGDNVDVRDVKAFAKVVRNSWKTNPEKMEALLAAKKPLENATDLLPLFRFWNHPKQQQVLMEANVRNTLQGDSPEGYALMWQSGWEIRNLRMVANIRETFRERPGARVLTIVGASHKPRFEQWLGQLPGIDIQDAEQVLR